MSIVVAVSSTTVFLDSQRVHIVQGSAWAADSPAVLEHPDLFSDDPSQALGLDLVPSTKGAARDEQPVEKKTANPGEKSNARRLFGGRRG